MFLFKSKSTPPFAWLVVFLGNPGAEYERTRHNVGWMVADELSKTHAVPIQKLKHRALTGVISVSRQAVLLMKPMTFMNLSGESVGEAARFYKIPPERILAVSDDAALPVGKLRLRTGGSSGGQKGLQSLISHLGTDQFPRLRIGVGQKPHPEYDMADWVLGKFSGEDAKIIADAAKRAADAVEVVVAQGIDAAMAKYN